ncbi:putative periplasmic thiol-disulphide interchange protein (DsbA family protein) [Pseudooceanicola batsensis HTCC2597]|uniref:Putative periplasmic thiol-disulphide interchange protein (DsbA family protein) n=1 Tax=Pseudooceanicola batsensis (strain ATCC BAA-863 / DSM 15984 / KCTC 12145 / HTCC2597) TaxID=252305 RepID=A3U249_PSEBH|nr:DsbA family protein [Pseudooceanicola batsensis]EAQ01649.1 putative periplasmic thiol-disulphide interchange protein (DsbA family protein) [Pseudooceanicola batsensis HTCC2597]
MDRRAFMLGGAAVAIAAAGGLWYASRPGTTSISTVTPVSAEGVDTSGVTEMTLGSDDAGVTLTEYASFTCPHCANFHQAVFKDLKRDYIDTGKVKFVYRDVYFDQFGLWAAMIARCEPTRFFGIADMLYAQQKDWIGNGDPAGIADRLRKIGLVAGLEAEAIDACLADEDKARSLVAWYQQNAEADEITGTPTLLIDGEKHSNMSYPDLREILDARLEG